MIIEVVMKWKGGKSRFQGGEIFCFDKNEILGGSINSVGLENEI